MPNCFVVMPFRPELRYLFLFIKQHIEGRYAGTACERGDATILTVPLLDKISNYIKRADVVIADCTGRNPNVFYELGMAHALGKPVVLITSDKDAEVPTDIRAFEYIRYEGDDEKAFVEKLDKALSQLLVSPFDEIYTCVLQFFNKFLTDTHRNLAPPKKEEFAAAAAERLGGGVLPKLDAKKTIATLFLPLMVPKDLDVMLDISKWIQQEFKEQESTPMVAADSIASARAKAEELLKKLNDGHG